MKSARILVWGNLPMNRSAIPEALADLSTWPTVDRTALDKDDAEEFDRRREAVRLFVEERLMRITEIEKSTSITRSQLYRLLDRCLSKHPDGRIHGFRGLIPYVHLKRYERVAQVKPCKPRGRGGSAGALNQALTRHPKIAAWMTKQAAMRKRALQPGEIREVRKNLRSLHREFLMRLTSAGVDDKDWPFNRDELGYRSFQKHMYKLEAGLLVDDESPPAGESPSLDQLADEAPPAMLPFDCIQFDGHKLDIRLTISFLDQLGLETLVELSRIWILVCIDVASRVVLGYSIAYSIEYDSDDVARALQSCFGFHKGPRFTIPGMSIRNDGGFPTNQFEQARYAGWKWFQFDSARSHLASSTLERLTDITGAFVKSGRLGEPNDRAVIERFFATLAKHGLHRIAGSTGSSPEDIVRELADVGSDLRLLITTNELEQVIEALLGDYNGESHPGLNGRTPMQAMRYFFEKPGIHIRQLPSTKRRELIFLQEARIITVRGKDKPYINFEGVRYTSDVLSSKRGLFGKRLRIYCNSQDIRQLHAYFEDGAELGILIASRSWRLSPHSLRQRQEILRLCRLGKLHYREGGDAIEAYTAYKRKQAKANKRAANALAELVKTEEMAKDMAAAAIAVAATATGAQVLELTPPHQVDDAAGIQKAAESTEASDSNPHNSTAPVSPKPLQARRTFTF